MAVLSAGALGLAFGSAGRVHAPGPSTRWHWPGGVPGRRITVDRTLRRAARRSEVGPDSIREAVVTSSGHRLLFGLRQDGRLCTAEANWRIVTTFDCLSDWTDRFAMVFYVLTGGPDRGTVGSASIVGVVRPDVRRVVVLTAEGTPVRLTLNRWRAFGYSTSVRRRLPTFVMAYDGAGRLLQREDVKVRPPRRVKLGER